MSLFKKAKEWLDDVGKSTEEQNRNTAIHNTVQSMAEDYDRSPGQVVNDINHDPNTQAEFNKRYAVEKLLADTQSGIQMWQTVGKVLGQDTAEIDEAVKSIKEVSQTKGRHLE